MFWSSGWKSSETPLSSCMPPATPGTRTLLPRSWTCIQTEEPSDSGALPVGVIRARFRNGYQDPQLLEAGKVEKYRILLRDMAHTFLPGHRIRIEISSSAFPFVAPNQNTGNPIATDTEWKLAHQAIYHSGKYPSNVALPLMP